MIKYVCPEYIKNSHYSIRQITGFKNGQKIWTNILPKKHMQNMTNIISNGKLKPLWDITTYLWEWLKRTRATLPSVGEDMKQLGVLIHN